MRRSADEREETPPGMKCETGRRGKVKMSHFGWRMLLASCRVGTREVGKKEERGKGDLEERVSEIMRRRRDDVGRPANRGDEHEGKMLEE